MLSRSTPACEIVRGLRFLPGASRYLRLLSMHFAKKSDRKSSDRYRSPERGLFYACSQCRLRPEPTSTPSRHSNGKMERSPRNCWRMPEGMPAEVLCDPGYDA